MIRLLRFKGSLGVEENEKALLKRKDAKRKGFRGTGGGDGRGIKILKDRKWQGSMKPEEISTDEKCEKRREG